MGRNLTFPTFLGQKLTVLKFSERKHSDFVEERSNTFHSVKQKQTILKKKIFSLFFNLFWDAGKNRIQPKKLFFLCQKLKIQKYFFTLRKTQERFRDDVLGVCLQFLTALAFVPSIGLHIT